MPSGVIDRQWVATSIAAESSETRTAVSGRTASPNRTWPLIGLDDTPCLEGLGLKYDTMSQFMEVACA